MDDIWLYQRLSVAIHNSISQMNPIARYSDDSFHQMQIRSLNRVKNDYVAMLDGPMMLKRIPFGIWSYSDAIHENVVAYKQCVLHRSGWDLKRLNVECDDEQSNSHHGCHRRNKLDGSLPAF